MKSRRPRQIGGLLPGSASLLPSEVVLDLMPAADALAALRAWFEGISARDAVHRYLGHHKADGQSSRALLGATRRQLAELAHRRRRPDLQQIFLHTPRDKLKPSAKAAASLATAIDQLRSAPEVVAELNDDVSYWFGVRTCGALRASGMRTLVDLTIRLPFRKVWWRGIPGVGVVGARRIEAFFVEHQQLTDWVRALVVIGSCSEVALWE